MLEKIRKRTGIKNNSENVRKIAIRIGIAMIVVLILLCYLEIKKETIAADWYGKTLYKATAQGRWLKYGQYEPDTLYQRIIDKIPILHYARMSGMQTEKGEEKSKQQIQNAEEKDNTGQTYGGQTQAEFVQSKDESEKKAEESNRQGKLLVRYAYGNIQPLQKGKSELQSESADMQNGQTGTQADSQAQIQQADLWEVINNSRRSVAEIIATVKEQYRWKETVERERFLKNYYIADVSVGDVSSVLNGEKLLSLDTSLERISEEPQILVYHTHGTEGYKDSRTGVEADTVVGMGDILCEELTKRGFSVLHDRTSYDYVNGKDNRNYAYTTARPQIEALLEEYPSIEVILDIHRDSGAARRTTINGKDTAQIMLFNGLCRNADGPISYLENPYLEETLAFSLQLNLLGRERYPGLMYKLYLKNYRYNMHFTGHCMLVELGTQNNTVEEAQNGVRYLAELLYELLTE